MKKAQVLSSAIVILLLTGMVSPAAQIFPAHNNLEIKVGVRVERQSLSHGIKYVYSIENTKGSNQILDYIRIEKFGLQEEFSVPSTWMANYSRGGSFSATPGVYKDGDPNNNPPQDGIKPGETLRDAIIFKNQGPPVITEWSVTGWAPVPILDEERGVIISEGVEYDADAWADTIMDHRDKLPNANPRDNRVRVMTIGPSKPVEDKEILCDTFILDLVAQVRDAAALGWIKHDLRKDRDDDDESDAEDDSDLTGGEKKLPGTAKSIIKKLKKVRRECMRGRVGNAREKLRALIKQVSAQRGKHLTEEAYTLIKFNAEFLLEKI